MTFDKAEFGRAVAARRKALGYPQTGVPGGPSSSYMSDIEHGKMDPISGETLDKLAAGLRWNRVVLGRIYFENEPISSLPTGPLDLDPRQEETFSDRILREAEDAQIAFEKAADALIAAEAELDRANWLAFKVILIQERMHETGTDARTADASVTPTAIAEVIAAHATTGGQEWTRFDMAILERFDPDYVDAIELPLETYQRYMDMTAARKRASRIPLPEGGVGNVTPMRPHGAPSSDGKTSEADETLEPAADDVLDADEEPGGSDEHD